MGLVRYPWRKLKEVESEALRRRRKGTLLPAEVSRLRRLVKKCKQDTDAGEAICYHGCLALIFEADRDWSNALKHRRLEISKIRRLHKLERENPTGGYATQHYREADLRERRAILAHIKSKAAEASSRAGTR